MPIPATGTVSYELAATLLTESVGIAARIVHGPVALGPLDNCLFATVVRGIRLTLGATALIEKRLQGEAFILGRSLFEDSLRIAEIGDDATNRKGLLLGWYLDSLTELENLHTAAKAIGQEVVPWHDMPGKVLQWRQELDAIAKRDRIKRKRFLSVKDAAKRFGRVHDYWTYQLAHEMVHGSEIANTFYRKIDPPVGGAAPNVYASTDSEAPVLATSCAFWCARSLLQAAGGAAVVFGRDPRDADDAFVCSNDLEGFLHEQVGFGSGVPQPPPPPRRS